MHNKTEPPPPNLEQRLKLRQLLESNPNFFGTAQESTLAAQAQIKFDTSYEELTCVGLWPEKNLLMATIAVKLPFGFLGDLCKPGSREFVRFFVDWNGDGDFVDFNEDAGVVELNVHDIPEVREHKLCYAVRQELRPFFASCKDPYIVKLRAILSWEIVPTGPNFIPIWGNILECWIQVDPVEGKLLGIVGQAEEVKDAKGEKKGKPASAPPRERVEFLKILDQNPNYFGTVPGSTLQAAFPLKFDTRFEELKCIGLYPEENFLEAIVEVKLPFGFLGDLCSAGSHEHVRFFLDWNGDGDFIDFNEDAGATSVNVHDIPQVREFHLCYALGRRFRSLRANCQHPRIVRVRAILSWQQVPTGPNFIPIWGNVVECWVQIRPTESTPPILVGQIDTPTANACVEPVIVPTCLTSGVPLAGIQIIGTAGGAPFTHYTLRYSWGANPLVNDAVVYPNCGRPPAVTSSTTPVFGGTLGYLDVSLLPVGQTQFTIHLDVFGSMPTVSVMRTFELKTTAVEVTAAATINALVGQDPFHLGSFTKLIKASNNPNPAVPELSIGGSFSVTGSAYTVGCNRIMSQFVLARFPAPPAAPVPNIPDATGGTPLIAPVVYGDTPSHPWQSGCFPISTPNTILNGNLVALWSANSCTFPFPHTVPKVKPQPFWNSSPLNGRFVLLLEVLDRVLPAGPFPGTFAAKDQVVVWIDNQPPEALIASVGGLLACADLHLKDYVGLTAEIRGVAWDPPIDPAAPQQQPNDNFGSYALSFQKNGNPAASGAIPGATPNLRVPNIWPGPLPPGAEGTLANWDIVAALDGGPGPLPPNSPKLARGERCAYVVILTVTDTTHVGDSGNHHTAGPVLYAINIINDIPTP